MGDEYERREGRYHHRREENEEGGYGEGRREQGGYGGREEGGYGGREEGGYGGRDEGGYGAPPRRQEGGYSEGGYSQGGYSDNQGGYGNQPVSETVAYQQTYETDQGIATSRAEVTKHKREEEVAGFGGLAAGAYALYEKHQEKVDPEHAARHKLEAEIGGAGFLGGEAAALYERHEKKNSQEKLDSYEDSLESGEKKHGWFG
ncbi:unnamed protein product [Calypogeia fissa]